MTKTKRRLLLFAIFLCLAAYAVVSPGRMFYYAGEWLDAADDYIAGAMGTSRSSNLESWIESAADSFGGGEGTSDEPYLIATTEQLALLARETNSGNQSGKNFKLVADIDLAGKEWVPIGTPDTPFIGYLNGNGHTVSNLRITSGGHYQGLFGCASVSVNNLSLVDGHVTGVNNVGLLLGGDTLRKRRPDELKEFVISDSEHLVKMNNVNVSGVVSGKNNVGGLAGRLYLGDIRQSNASADVTGRNRVGGLIGLSKEGLVVECTVKGDVSGQGDVGGLIGYHNAVSMGILADQFMYYAKVVSSAMSGKVSGKSRVGGLLGRGYCSWVIDSTVSGIVYGDRSTGGITGRGESVNIFYCSALTNVLSRESNARKSNNKGNLAGCLIGGSVRINNYNAIFNVCLKNEGLALCGALRSGASVFENVEIESGDLRVAPSMEIRTSTVLPESALLGVGMSGFRIVPRNLVGLGLSRYRENLRIGWQTSAQEGDYTVLLVKDNRVQPVRVLVRGSFEDIARSTLNWIDFAAASFDGGDGTQRDPYHIATPEQLARVALLSNRGEFEHKTYFKLTKDIDLSGKYWTPIINPWKTGQDLFHGHYFDGNYRTISNFLSYSQGLFGNVESVDIVGVCMTRANIGVGSYGNNTGLLAGNAHRSFVSNCVVEGSIWGDAVNRQGIRVVPQGIGGILGSVFESNISHCISSVNISAAGEYIGGLLGYSQHSSLIDNHITGQIAIEGRKWALVGSLIGKNSDAVSIDNVISSTVEMLQDMELLYIP